MFCMLTPPVRTVGMCVVSILYILYLCNMSCSEVDSIGHVACV